LVTSGRSVSIGALGLVHSPATAVDSKAARDAPASAINASARIKALTAADRIIAIIPVSQQTRFRGAVIYSWKRHGTDAGRAAGYAVSCLKRDPFTTVFGRHDVSGRASTCVRDPAAFNRSARLTP
jgi:hypothetical protein